MSEQIGPKITITYQCTGCKYSVSEYYRLQGDSGFNYFCTHPFFQTREEITYNTKKVCPVLNEK